MILSTHANKTSARPIAPDPSSPTKCQVLSSAPFHPHPPFLCYCSQRMKNNQSLETVQEFAVREKEESDVCFPLLFLSVSPFSPSRTTKIINHLPADKISCSLGEQLQHLVGSCDEVRSKFFPFPASPGLNPSAAGVTPNMQLKKDQK